ncbi:MAG: hypothetical protein H6688_00495 [Erysipelotrichaceae bacterium]|nr:hypothetical protein [Erysipelotrichaceae bacterium]
MEGLFKSFGKGLLYIFVLPFFLLVMAGYALVGLIAFIFLFFKSIILFFCGRSLDIELPEDKKAKEIIRNALPASSNPVFNQGNVQQPFPNNIPSSSNPPSASAPVNVDPHSVEEACFGQNKPIVSENKKEIPPEINNHQVSLQNEELPPIEEKQTDPVIVKNNEPIISPRDNVSQEKYSPKRTSLVNEPLEENEKKTDDSHNGIDIDFKDF